MSGSVVRWAVPGDAEALVGLRAAMFDAMGQDPIGEAWRTAARAWFAERLAGPDLLIAVADVPGRGPVSSAMAVVERRAPSPSNPSGLAAHLSQVSTLPGHRRHGHARACLLALLAELDRREVRRTDLFATGDGEALYLDVGFRPSPYPALRRP
ncbi:GNAT family N-acetyltransferase [uncultured Amnibacterium sp.]|uniref:GNAT family N-acetyltransferase n=1 Tax=uncultured Amnibacterium sp. TaxID=1631851 RepID=UPI0035CC2AC6